MFYSDPYLSCLPNTYYNVSIQSVLHSSIIDRYLNACNVTYQHKNMQQYDLAPEKY